MEYEYSLIQAQHYLVEFLSQKNYFINNNSKIYSKLFNAQLILNEYINSHLKSIHDNYNYKSDYNWAGLGWLLAPAL